MWMLAPIAACLVMALILGWFGLHVLEREVIFVDLALAQVAALGTTVAVFLGHDPDEPAAYVLGLVFTVLGAVAFSMARFYEKRVPQEAIIGIAYAVGAAAAAVVLDFGNDPHGAEKLQHLTVGNIVWATWGEIGAMAAVAGLIAVFHGAFRARFLDVSFRPEEAAASGVSVALWDLLFYLTFGVVITTIVHVGGVLLIFSYLIVPAVIARLFVDGVMPRLVLAWSVAAILSVIGVAVSYEHAAGPIIVVLLGAALLASLLVYALRTSESPGRVAAGVVGTVAGLAVILFALKATPGEEHEHAEPVHVAERGIDPDPIHRAAQYRADADKPDALAAALPLETDESLKLLLGTALSRDGDARGLQALADLTKSETPFTRMEADDRLRKVAGAAAPAYDPLSGPDNGAWAAWAAAPPAGWESAAKDLALPE